MKAILVVDTPICEECPCYHEDRSVCQAGGLYGKPCPLRPIPNEACQRLVEGLDAMEKMKSVEVRVVRRTE